MNEIIKSFGNNAGKIWDVLNEEGPQVQTKLMKKTNLTTNEFYGAVGWLARENKLVVDKRTYKIGDTNLTEEIGESAGKVWNVLGSRSEIDVSAITRISKIKKRNCYSALGWLAREGKITAKITVKKK
ncbi:MAG: winged helix-turn-helix domain-containing protein [Candidatus Thermoplasmatota archaeon]|nr:winged helix-turn-helix domain-containing protein [Candidatus Thermoplasmatota archaeon]